MDENEKQIREALAEVVDTWEEDRGSWIVYAFKPGEDSDIHRAAKRARGKMLRDDKAAGFITSLEVYREGLKILGDTFGFALPPDVSEEVEARLAELPRDPLA